MTIRSLTEKFVLILVFILPLTAWANLAQPFIAPKFFLFSLFCLFSLILAQFENEDDKIIIQTPLIAYFLYETYITSMALYRGFQFQVILFYFLHLSGMVLIIFWLKLKFLKERIYTLLVISGFVVSLIGLIEFFGGLTFIDNNYFLGQILNPVALKLNFAKKIGSTFGYKNFVAEFLGCTLLLSFLLKNKRKKLFYLLFTVQLLYIVFSKTRASWVALLMTAFIYLLFSYKKIIKTRNLLVGGVFCILFSLLLSLQYLRNDRVIEEIGNTNVKKNLVSIFTRYSERDLLWKAGIKMILDKPFTGHGSFSFQPLYPKFSKGKHISSTRTFNDVHNFILQLLLEGGLLGLLLILLFMVPLFKNSFLIIKNNEINIVPSALVLIFLFINALFSFPLSLPCTIFVFYLSVSEVLNYEIKNKHFFRPFSINWLKIPVFCLVILTVVLSVLNIYLSHLEYNTGRALFANDSEKLSEAGEAFLFFDPYHSKVSLALAQKFISERDGVKCLEYAEKALKVQPYSLNGLKIKVKCLLIKNEFDTAGSVINELTEIYPDRKKDSRSLTDELHNNMYDFALKMMKNGNNDQALTIFIQLLKINYEQPYIYGNIGSIYEARGNLKEALLWYEKFLTKWQQSAKIRITIQKVINNLKAKIR